MLHFLLVDDCYPINTRNRKILDSLAMHYGEQAKISVITWDRNNDYTEPIYGYHVYKKISAYGNKTRKLFNLWSYRKFCHSKIKEIVPDVIIASHWNNLLMVPRLSKKQMFIYENLDVPTESFLIRKATTLLEHWEMRRVHLTIHASRFFTKLYSPKKKQLVLENKPTFKAPLSQEYTLRTPIRIAFIGLIRYREILRLLIDAVKDDKRFELYFHGEGHARTYLEDYANHASNVFFTGKYAYEDVAKFYEQTDVVWAAYPNKDFNVKYAISNKFHESLTFGKPTVYADNTLLGDFVEKEHIGMKVDPYSIDAIKEILNTIANYPDNLKSIATDMQAFYSKQTSWKEDFKEVTKAIDLYLSKNAES